MDEQLDQLGTLRAAEASPQALYGDAGMSVRRYGRSQRDPRYLLRLAETIDLVTDLRRGRVSEGRFYAVREQMTTSDFSLLMADAIDRQLLARYQETTPSWSSIARRAVVPDFRAVKRFAVDGAEGLLSVVTQGAPYPAAALTEASYTYAVAKRGRRLPMSWETMINDDLEAFLTLPDRLARAARRSEEHFATSLFVGSSGLNTGVFTVGNKNIINATNSGGGFTAVNPPLSIDAVRQAYAVLNNQRDADGQPIMIEGVTLWVPPALEGQALEIVNATQIFVGDFDATGAKIQTANWIGAKAKVSVGWYIPYIATTNGNTTWFLAANPATSRPAGEIGFLRGHESPELFLKAPNAIALRGGAEPMEDFDTDAVDHKVRHVFGGAAMDPKVIAGSNGSGS